MSERRRRDWRRAGVVGLAALSFFVGTSAVGAAFPPHLPVLTPKLDYFREHASAYTTVFIGTSLVYRQVIPEVIDTVARAAGHDERTFNLGVPALSVNEAESIVDTILAANPARLRRIVLDVRVFPPHAGPAVGTLRYVAWHSTANSLRFLVDELMYQPSALEWLDSASDTLTAWIDHVSATGTFAAAFRSAWDRVYAEREEEIELPISHAGYEPLGRYPDHAMRRRNFALALPKFEELVQKRVAAADTIVPGLRVVERELERIVARIERSGRHALFFEGAELTPRTKFTSDTLAALPLLSLNSPAKFPLLYRAEYRFDMTHANEQGARLLSEAVGRQLLMYPR